MKFEIPLNYFPISAYLIQMQLSDMFGTKYKFKQSNTQIHVGFYCYKLLYFHETEIPQLRKIQLLLLLLLKSHRSSHREEGYTLSIARATPAAPTVTREEGRKVKS
jgi:hypothetical protein